MFSYVAKSLLSKTLRTFLRKYLENIELESIDYGSSSSTASADISSGKSQPSGGNSGWGVRLSNVKLREGMELVKLPGKRKRVVARKKKVKRNKAKKSPADFSVESTPITKNSKRTIELDDARISPPLLPMVSDGDEAVDVSACENNTMGTSSSIEGEIPGVIINGTDTLPLHKESHNRASMSSADSENGYFSSGPTTPTQSRHGICGVPSTFCLNNSSRRAMESQKETNVRKVSLPFDEEGISNRSRAGDVNGECNHECNKDIPFEKIDLGPRQEDSIEDNTTPSVSIDKCKAPQMPTDEDISSDDDSFIEMEEESVVEDDMALVVGAGGVIGTLNIRMVGKELHVTVEDAELIVEAVPSESISEEGNNINASPDTKPGKLDRSTSSSSEAELTNLADENEGKTTTGEKIKEKSMLAKYLSSIPHLFLRDCRVSLILPEQAGDDEEATRESVDDCTIFELGIDFLSVTGSSGDDFLDVLRFDTGSNSPEAKMQKPQPHASRRTSSVASESEKPSSNTERKRPGGLNSQRTQNNIFSRKRIRTGKGPEGGVWIKIHPPGGTTWPQHARYAKEPWARRRFLDSSESFFLRFSGLDLHARMLVEVKDEGRVDEIENAWGNEYDDYTLDSMLFGVDYIDPISLTRHQIKEKMRELPSKPLSDESSDVVSATDQNGIQTVPFASNLHWIAQGRHCGDCANSNLPLHDCFHCLMSGCVQHKPESESSMHSLTPLPGFVFCLSMSDPLEVNVDRNSLDAFGYMKSLFTPQKLSTDEDIDDKESAQEAKEEPKTNREAPHTVSPECAISKEMGTFGDKSFPSFMQPDTIYLSGVHVSKIIVRIEAIQPRTESRLKFRFWQFIGESIQYEESQVDAEEQFVRDVTFHVGSLECKDFTGVCEKNIILTELSSEPQSSKGGVHLPCTASRVLGVSFPTENRLNRYAAHARVVQSDVPKAVSGQETASLSNINYVNLRMGVVHVDVGSTLAGDVSKASSEASLIFSNGPKEEKESKPESPQVGRKWLYEIQPLGGTLSYQPRIKMKIPESKFRMRKGGSEGFSFEAIVHRLGIEYGSYAFQKPASPSIIPLCNLQESLRLHILLYLGDLSPLESVLNIHTKKKKSSAFLRCHAVNKKLSRLGVTSAKNATRRRTEVSRRNVALARLQSLDTDALETLLLMHGRLHE